MRTSGLRSAAALASVAALAGCGAPRHPAGGHEAAARRALNAGGEPQWSALVRGGLLTVATGEGPPLSVQARLQDHGGGGMTWSGRAAPAGGRPGPGVVTLTVAARPCQDADTGISYPFTALLQAPAGRYTGCAALPGQGLGPRR